MGKQVPWSVVQAEKVIVPGTFFFFFPSPSGPVSVQLPREVSGVQAWRGLIVGSNERERETDRCGGR